MRTATILGVLLASFASSATAAERPRFHYRVVYEDLADDPAWSVTITASGLDRAQPMRMRLENWGEWTDVADEHLSAIESEPPLVAEPDDRTMFRLTRPARWDGRFRASYRIHVRANGTREQRQHGLLPRCTPTHSIGFTSNTLMIAMNGGEWLDAEREIEIVGPRDWKIVSGFAATATGRQTAHFDGSTRNTVIAFCDPISVATSTDGPAPIEVVQLGGAGEVAERVRVLVRRIVDEATRCFGSAPERPVKIVVTHPHEGGVRVDGAICVGFSDQMSSDRPSPYTVQFIAHETVHDWLGGQLEVDDGRFAWFVEGFTDYLSLWIVAATGLVDRAWFVERLTELDDEISKLPAYATTVYSDPTLRWRDPSIEPLAYQAAPVLAFGLDAELRRAKKPGLPALVRDLIARGTGRANGEDVADWLKKHGLEKCEHRWISGKERPKTRAVVATLTGVTKEGEERPLPDSFFEFEP